jgi:hypothetical protein
MSVERNAPKNLKKATHPTGLDLLLDTEMQQQIAHGAEVLSLENRLLLEILLTRTQNGLCGAIAPQDQNMMA